MPTLRHKLSSLLQPKERANRNNDDSWKASRSSVDYSAPTINVDIPDSSLTVSPHLTHSLPELPLHAPVVEPEALTTEEDTDSDPDLKLKRVSAKQAEATPAPGGNLRFAVKATEKLSGQAIKDHSNLSVSGNSPQRPYFTGDLRYDVEAIERPPGTVYDHESDGFTKEHWAQTSKYARQLLSDSNAAVIKRLAAEPIAMIKINGSTKDCWTIRHFDLPNRLKSDQPTDYESDSFTKEPLAQDSSEECVPPPSDSDAAVIKDLAAEPIAMIEINNFMKERLTIRHFDIPNLPIRLKSDQPTSLAITKSPVPDQTSPVSKTNNKKSAKRKKSLVKLSPSTKKKKKEARILAETSGNAGKDYSYSEIVKGDRQLDTLRESIEEVSSHGSEWDEEAKVLVARHLMDVVYDIEKQAGDGAGEVY